MPRSFGERAFTRLPPMYMSPAVMSSSPATRRSRVDLPQPDGPTNTTNSPSSMSRSTPWMISTPPKRLTTFLRTTSAIAASPALPARSAPCETFGRARACAGPRVERSALHGAGGEAGDDPALEDQHQDHDRHRHDHGGGHDVAPGQLELRRARQQRDRHRNGALL